MMGVCRLHAVALVLSVTSSLFAGEARVPSRAPRQLARPKQLIAPRATLLVVGDSLVGGPIAFARVLRERLQPERIRVVEDTWVGVGVQRFAYSQRFRDLVARHRPTYVFIVLGTNDYALPTPRAVVPAVERVARVAGAVPCAWVGPIIRKDTGVVQVIAEHASPCTFVDSRRFEVATSRDGIHPTVSGARVWVEGVLETLKESGWTWPQDDVTP
jgi:lysophospholipase L1-like esterase